MNVLSLLPIPRTLSFFSSLVIGGIFIWSTLLLMVISMKNDFWLNVLTSPYINQADKEFNWLFLFFIFIVSYMAGEFFLAMGDIFLNAMFRGSFLNIRDVVYSLWNLRDKSFLVEYLSLRVEYPAITLDVFQNVEKNYYLEKSEYYYSLSNLFAGLLLALIWSVALVFSVTKRNLLGTLLINETQLVNIIPLIWGVITTALLVKIKFITKFILRKLKDWNQEIIVRFIYFAIVVVLLFPFYFVLKESKVISLNGLESLIIINFALLPLISILLSIRYRELANLFLYLAYLESKRDKS